MKTLIIIFYFLSFSLYALPLPQSHNEFCQRFQKTSGNLSTLQDMAIDPVNLMAFKNTGGLFNAGVCWWHSRFQRNIFYLAIFRPDLPKSKTELELKSLIHQIRLGQKIITVPGYYNFEEFSLENKDLIQRELNDWQLYDGVILGRWIDGLKGETKIESHQLEKMMEELNEYVGVEKKIAYQKLQIKGLTSHAWLIVGIKKTDSGFELGYLDSNSPRQSLNYSYLRGDESFFVKGYGNFVPYLEFKREEVQLQQIALKSCGLKINAHFSSEYKLDLLEAINAGKNANLIDQ